MTCKNCERVENGQIIYWDNQGNCIECGRNKEFYLVNRDVINTFPLKRNEKGRLEPDMTNTFIEEKIKEAEAEFIELYSGDRRKVVDFITTALQEAMNHGYGEGVERAWQDIKEKSDAYQK